MISKQQVLMENPQYKTLINAVINRIGMNAVDDVNNHGISGGFCGFIYYKETVAFYKRYRKIINTMVFEMADELGESPVEMVGGFGCVKAYDYEDKKWDDTEDRDNIGRCIYGGSITGEQERIANVLAWFAAEEVCHMFDR